MIRRVLAAGLAAVLAAVGLVAVAPAASADITRVQATNFRCAQTLYSGTYQPAATSVHTLTYTVTSPAPVGGSLNLSVSFSPDPLNGPLALGGVTATARAEFRVFKNGAAQPDVTATGANSGPQSPAAFGPMSTPQPATAAYPLTGSVLGDAFEFVPVAFRVDLTGGDAGPSGGSIRCIAVDAPNSYVAVPESTLRTTVGTSVLVTGVPGPSADRCEIPTPSSPPCATSQDLELSITAGKLAQRAYQGGSNPNSTTINLGSLTTPLAPTPVPGVLNPITVTDNRGGSYGWTLSAVLTNFTGAGSNSIANSRLAGAPVCSPAAAGQGWDYDAPGQTQVTGYDPATVAPGAVAGGAGQTFGGTVTLCVKDSQVNPTSQSSGGIYTVSAPLTLTMPSFQAADSYTATMTITLV